MKVARGLTAAATTTTTTCHGSWGEVAYIDYGNQAINTDMDEEN